MRILKIGLVMVILAIILGFVFSYVGGIISLKANLYFSDCGVDENGDPMMCLPDPQIMRKPGQIFWGVLGVIIGLGVGLFIGRKVFPKTQNPLKHRNI